MLLAKPLAGKLLLNGSSKQMVPLIRYFFSLQSAGALSVPVVGIHTKIVMQAADLFLRKKGKQRLLVTLKWHATGP